jgi:RNA polymerase sigma factor (sigma-70 family)
MVHTTLLVREAQQGKRQALEDLFTRYLPRVRQIVALRLGRKMREFTEEEDLVQDAMLRAFQGLDRFEQRTEGSFRNWLARCVEHAIVDRGRRERAGKRGGGNVRRLGDFGSESLHDSVFADPRMGPKTAFLVKEGAKEFDSKLERALLGLSPRDRELVVLRHLCKMSYEEVAQELGLESGSTARRACARAVLKLSERLGLDGENDPPR